MKMEDIVQLTIWDEETESDRLINITFYSFDEIEGIGWFLIDIRETPEEIISLILNTETEFGFRIMGMDYGDYSNIGVQINPFTIKIKFQ